MYLKDFNGKAFLYFQLSLPKHIENQNIFAYQLGTGGMRAPYQQSYKNKSSAIEMILGWIFYNAIKKHVAEVWTANSTLIYGKV